MMNIKIDQTQAYQRLNDVAKMMVVKRANRLQIEDAVIQAKNLGLEVWNTQTNLPHKWREIVEEILKN